MARLDRLGAAKSIAQLGAVLGRSFSYALLQAASSLDEQALSQSLTELVASELLYQRGNMPNATFTFKHALIQEMAYETLLRQTRRQHHQRVAQVLTERFPDVEQTQPELLAHHYTEAGDLEHALDYWLQAGRLVFQRSAHVEAIGHLSRGLALLEGLPPSPERDQLELDFQTVVGPALMAVKGQGSPEVGQAYARARELCQRVGETPQLLPVLFGLWRYYLMRAEHRTALQVGKQCLSLAQQLHDSALLLPAHFTLGASLQFKGDDLVLAQMHLDQGIALYNPQAHRELAFRYGVDLGVWHLAYAAWNRWFLGYPDQSIERSREAIALAEELNHALSMAATLAYVTVLHVFRREPTEAQRRAEETIAFANQHDFPQWRTLTTIYEGWALTLPRADPGRAISASPRLGDMAGARSRAGVESIPVSACRCLPRSRTARYGLAAVAEGLAFMEQTAEGVWEAELHRLQGELLLLLPVDRQAEAERCFQTAIAAARRRQTKSWELRAANSLARLWQSQGKRQEACDLLAPIYAWFTEGFETADLQDAKVLLDNGQ